MGSGYGKKIAREAKAASSGALERVEKLEAFRNDVLQAMRQTFGIVDTRLQNTEDVVNALIILVGKEDVEKKVQELQIERLEAKAGTEKAALDAAVTANQVVVADVIGDRSVIVGSEVDKDGKQLYPSRVQLLFPTVKDDYKERLRGAKAGDVIETPVGSKFTILEVYDIVLNPPPPAAEAGAREVDVPQSEEVPTSGDEPAEGEVEKQLVEDLAAIAQETDPTIN